MSLRFLHPLNSLSKRIYVHESVYDEFVTQYVDLVKVTVPSGIDSCGTHTPHQKKYVLGDPTKPETSLGPVVSVASAEKIRKQVTDAGEDPSVSLPPHRPHEASSQGGCYDSHS